MIILSFMGLIDVFRSIGPPGWLRPAAMLPAEQINNSLCHNLIKFGVNSLM